MKNLKMSSAVFTVAIFFAFSSAVAAQSVNLAFGKSATQSADMGQPFAAGEGLAFKAVDGNTDGTWNSGSVTSTACGVDATNECRGSTNPWWQVDLGGEFIVERLQIWNRTDCCSDRLDNYRIWVKGNIGNWEEYDTRLGAQRFSQQNPLTINGRKSARFVRIQIESPAAILSLAEVMVFGAPLKPVAPQTQGMTRQQLEDEFRTSPEAQRHGPPTDVDFTASLYWRYLGHGPDGNLQMHAARITSRQMTRQQLEDEFRTCPEAQRYGMPDDTDFTTSLYWRYLGHGPDGNLQFHTNRLSPGQINPVFLPQTPVQPVTNQGNNADVQFWDAVKNSQRAQDFQSYLSAFPNGQFAALARFNRDRLSGVSSPPTNTGSGTVSGGGLSVDEQFWNNVKNSNNARDFQSYLDNFPNGQFAALARFNRDRLGGVSSPPSNTGSGTVSGGGMSVDEQFWNNVKNSNNARDYQSYLDNFPNGQFASLARFNRDRLSGGGGVTSPPVFIPATSPNAALLNKSAAETRTSLPLTLGQVQLFAAESHCASGCQVSDNTDSVVISAKTPNLSKQNMTIGQIEAFLKPQLLKTYCGTPEQRSGISMGVTAVDMFNQPYGNFFLVTRDCGGTTGTTFTPPTIAKPPVTGFQQIISAAQPGSISEIARARRFFVVSNDFSVKSKITAAILKELPQMQAASTEQQADFLIGFELTDRTTGLVTANDAANPNLRGELIVFTMIPATGSSPERVRILFRVTKERGFGVFSATPDENAAKEFAKQFAKVII